MSIEHSHLDHNTKIEAQEETLSELYEKTKALLKPVVLRSPTKKLKTSLPSIVSGLEKTIQRLERDKKALALLIPKVSDKYTAVETENKSLKTANATIISDTKILQTQLQNELQQARLDNANKEALINQQQQILALNQKEIDKQTDLQNSLKTIQGDNNSIKTENASLKQKLATQKLIDDEEQKPKKQAPLTNAAPAATLPAKSDDNKWQKLVEASNTKSGKSSKVSAAEVVLFGLLAIVFWPAALVFAAVKSYAMTHHPANNRVLSLS